MNLEEKFDELIDAYNGCDGDCGECPYEDCNPMVNYVGAFMQEQNVDDYIITRKHMYGNCGQDIYSVSVAYAKDGKLDLLVGREVLR